MSRARTVTGRKVQEGDGVLFSVIPSEIVDRYEIEKGDTVIWADDGDGEPKLQPPEKD